MFARFTYEARQAIVRAQEIARLAGARKISDAHILSASVESPVGHVLVRLGGARPQRLAEILHHHESDVQVRGHIPFTKAAKKLIERSLRESLKPSHAVISSGHLVAGAAAASRPTAARDALRQVGVEKNRIREVLQSFDFLSHEKASESIHQYLFEHVQDDEPTTLWLLRDQIDWAIFTRVDLERGRNTFEMAVDRHGPDFFACQAMFIGELSGDVRLIMDNAHRAVDQCGRLAGELRASLALALAENDRPREAGDALAAALATKESGTVLVDAAKTELVNGNAESALQYLARARSAEDSDSTTIRRQIDLLEGRISGSGGDALVKIARATASSCFLILLRGLAQADLAARMEPGPRAIETCDQIADEYRSLGMYEPVLEALTRKARFLRELDKPEAQKAEDEAMSLARSLGRLATARRLAEDRGDGAHEP